MDAFALALHRWLVGIAATIAGHHPDNADWIRAMPWLIETLIYAWLAFTFVLGVRCQRDYFARISVPFRRSGTAREHLGTAGFTPPEMELPSGERVRARLDPEGAIASWVPVPNGKDARVIRP
jgi:hypothetical protein